MKITGHLQGWHRVGRISGIGAGLENLQLVSDREYLVFRCTISYNLAFLKLNEVLDIDIVT